MKNKTKITGRILWVDALRGLAIVLMVIFHFCYDLRYFDYVDWDVPNGPNWRPFRYLILTLFIFTVGMSLSLAHGRGIRWSSFAKRLIQLILAALAITAMSLFMFPDGWIYFGILHFIVVASLFGIALVKVPALAMALGLLILSGYWLGFFQAGWPFHLASEFLPSYTEDFVPLFPWLGVAFFGIGAGRILPLGKLNAFVIPGVSYLAFLGRYGLVVYLIHQPLLFAGVFTFGYIF